MRNFERRVVRKFTDGLAQLSHFSAEETEAREMKCLARGYRAASGQENLDPGFSDPRAQVLPVSGVRGSRLVGKSSGWQLPSGG